MATEKNDNVDWAELAHFERQAAQWWDPRGEFGALHDINPLRADYVAERVPLSGQKLLDAGCGGGVLSEALAARGANVTGIDLGDAALAVARRHAEKSNLSITYVKSSIEAMASAVPGTFDVVTCMELLEHVPDPAAIVRACAALVRPGGDVFFATLNRTLMSGFLAIFMAETVLRIVAAGTHRYDRFIRPDTLLGWGEASGLHHRDFTGFIYLPFIRLSRRTRSTRVNYLAHFQRCH